MKNKYNTHESTAASELQAPDLDQADKENCMVEHVCDLSIPLHLVKDRRTTAQHKNIILKSFENGSTH